MLRGLVIGQRPVGIIASVTVAAALIGGCGGTSGSGTSGASAEAKKPARQILDDAAAALSRARSLEMQGTLEVEGRLTRVAVEVEQRAVSLRLAEHNREAAMRVLPGGSYIKANSAFFEHTHEVPSSAIGLIANRWLKLPASGEMPKSVKQLSPSHLARCIAQEPGTLVVAGTSELQGRPAVVIVNKGDKPGSTPSRFYVAATGEPFLLRAVATGKERPGAAKSECNEGSSGMPGDELTFSRYNAPLHISAPVGALELSRLAQELKAQTSS